MTKYVTKVAVIVIAILSTGCGKDSTPTTPSTTPAVVAQPATPTPTPQPSTVTFTVEVGEVSPGAAAVTERHMNSDITVAGGRVIFADVKWITPHIILHEFGHVAGSAHQSDIGVMYPTGTFDVNYTDSETNVFTQFFGMSLGTPCPSGATQMFKELACGDNTASIANSGLHSVYPLTRNIALMVPASLASYASLFQDAATKWAGKYGNLTMTVTVASSSNAVAVTSPVPPPGTHVDKFVCYDKK